MDKDDAVPDPVNPDEARAFREGQFSARLDGHDRHFEDINGSLAKQAEALVDLATEVGHMNDSVTGMALVMPKLQTVADEVQKAEVVAEALRLKTEADRTTWDRYRGIVAWGLGVLIATVTIANFTSRILGIAAKQPPVTTVTMPDITPGYP